MHNNEEDTYDEPGAEEGSFLVTTGALAERGDIRITQEEDLETLTIEMAREAPLTVTVKPVPQGSKMYLQTGLSPLLRNPTLAQILKSCLDLTKRKSIRVHELVAILGRGAVLRASAQGQVGVHHVNLATGDNRAENLRVLRTRTHNALHRELDGLTDEERQAYLDSIPASGDGLGEGLSEDVRASINTDLAELENVEPAEPEEEDETAPFEGPSEEEEEEAPYYPDSEPISDLSGEASGIPGGAVMTPEYIQQLADELGEPDTDDLDSMQGRRLKMLQVAKALSCGVTSYLLEGGHSTLSVGALRETFEAQGATFVFEAGYLYRYNEKRGRYELANDAFEREVVEYAEGLAEELRCIRLVAGAWPIKTAAKVLTALPKLKPPSAIIQDCSASLFRTWRATEPMNGNQWTLNVSNGLYDLKRQRLLAFTPKHLSSLQLPFPFDPEAGCPEWLAYLAAAVPDAATRDVLQEWFGYQLIPTTKYEKALFLFGGGGTGKSTFIKTLRKLVGEGNCAAVGLEDLGDKFRVGGLRDKLLNVVTEVNPTRALNDARFKAFVSGDPVTGEQKFKDPGVFQPFARFVVAANTLPRILDQTDAFYRRVIMVRFDQKFVASPNPQADPPEKPQDPLLAEKLDAEMPGILNWALEGLARLEQRGRFEIPASLQANVQAFREDQDNALRFLHDGCVFGPDLEASTSDLYRAYLAWCKAHGEKPHANNRFGQIVTNYPGVQAGKSGNKGRYYRGLRPADADAVGMVSRGGEGGGSGAPKAGVPPLPKGKRGQRSA